MADTSDNPGSERPKPPPVPGSLGQETKLHTANQPSKEKPPKSNRPKFQFSMKSLLGLVTVCAILLGAASGFPSIFSSILTLLFVSTSAVMAAGLLYGKGDVQAFCLGGLFPAIVKTLQFAFSDGLSSAASLNSILKILSPSSSGSSIPDGMFVLVEFIGELLSLGFLVAVVGCLTVWVRRKLEEKSS